MTRPAVDHETRSTPGTAEVSLSSAVRDATASVHARLEQALPLTDPRLTIDAYRRIVEAFHGFYAPLEARLDALGDAAPMRGRHKVGRLREDLRALGADVETWPRCTSVPDVSTEARALGCLYVVEGATLGGRVIVGALHQHLGLGPQTGASFFHGYGAETGAMWRAFRAQLDTSPWPRAATIDAAVETFSAFEAWLRTRGALR